jgi:pullulanase
MSNYRSTLGLFALVLSLAVLSGCGGASGTDNDPVALPTCRDPLVLLDNGVCGDAPPPYVPPPCPEGQITNSLGVCIVPDFPPPTRMPTDDEVVIYVNIEGNQSDKNDAFASYNLHLWQDCGNGWADETYDGSGARFDIPTTWPAGPGVSSTDDGEPEIGHDPYYGAFFVVPTSEAGTCGNYIVKTPGGAAQTNDLQMSMRRAGGDYDRMAFIIVNATDMRNSRVSDIPVCINDVCTLEQPLLSITDVEAHWIDTHTIIWNREFDADKAVELYRSTAGGMTSADDGSIAGGSLLTALNPARELNDDEKLLVPHLASYFAYDLPASVSIDVIKEALKDELLIVGRFDSVEESVTIERGRATRIQLPHVLDALYTAGEDDADEATLGISYNDGVHAALWAPAAQKVELRVYSGDPLRVAETIDLEWDSATGIWHYTGSLAQLDRKFFRYRVTTYNPVAKRIHRLEVTDPYAISLSTNSRFSQFVNFTDDELKPTGWDGHSVPEASAPEAMSIYEMHVRDFSINDATTPAIYRGKYMAFTQTDSDAVAHLQQLATAGLTHVHLLPTNDMSSINEDVGTQVNLDSYVFELCQRVPDRDSVSACDGSVSNGATVRSVLESYDSLTDEARALTDAIKDLDAFNWGYDPYHFNTPEGSYATDPHGIARIKEKRAMTMALHQMGLRVVMDVVYPHTTASGVEVVNSVFDKVVPGYYYRTNPATAQAEQGTGAGPDTATEHRMMAKFVADSVVQWAREYKIDGFRFDQSGYMPKSVLVDAYDAVKQVDADNYFYAEAWTPGGGTSGERIAVRAVQRELDGTGIGTFNDTLRNALQQLRLIKGENADAIRAGLAGNLSDFELKAGNGAVIRAELVGAYNADPQEAINYVEKHDNETFWDWMHRPNLMLPVDTTLENRVRIHSLTQSIPVLSQGVPFIHLGSDLLRSKSMSPNSYNAGDWFNLVDYTRQSNNWAVGLPPELRDGITDADVLALFENTETKPANAEIELSAAVFQEFLSIASSSPLFSLQTAQDVIDRVGFHDGGMNQQAGVIVMSIDDGAGTVHGADATARADLDANVDAIVVMINGSDSSKSAQVMTSVGFVLHDTLQSSADMVVRAASFTEAGEGEEGGTFMVPAYTTAIFVKPQAGAQGEGLSARVTLEQSDQEPPPYANSVYVRGSVYDAEWSAGPGNEMIYHGKGIYSVVLNVAAGSYAFKLGAADWSSPNLGGPATVTLGTSLVLTDNGGDLSITIAEAGLYRFELDTSESLTSPRLRVFPDPFMGVSAHVRGSLSPSEWDVSVDNMLRYEGNGIYAAIFDVTGSAEGYEFKIASDDWATVNLGRNEAIEFTLGDEWPLEGGANNIPITIAETGRYRFEVNVFDPEIPTIRVYVDNLFSATPVYLRGTVSAVGWEVGDDNQLNYRGAGLYTRVLTMAAGSYEFKVAEVNWTDVNLGGEAVVLGVAGTLAPGGENIPLTIETGGDYLFTLDTTFPEAITLTVDAVSP